MPTKKKPAPKKAPVAAKAKAKAPVKAPAKAVKKPAAKPAAAKPAVKPAPAAESSAPASTYKKGSGIPSDMRTVTPHLVCAGAAEAIEFYKKAFAAVEYGRMPGPDGKLIHAMIRIGDSAVMLVDEMPNWQVFGPKALKGTPVTIHLYVEDADATMAAAVAAGAKITMPLEDMFWGDRYGKVEDPFGHSWSIATHLRDVSPEEMQAAMQKMPANG